MDSGSTLIVEVSGFSDVLTMDNSAVQDGLGFIDAACATSVAGAPWWARYKAKLTTLWLMKHVKEVESTETFNFGNGQSLPATQTILAPAVFANHLVLIKFHLVNSPGLGLLLGRDVLDGMKCDISLGRPVLRIDGRETPLKQGPGGHVCANLAPESFNVLRSVFDVPAPDELSRRLQPLRPQRTWTASVRARRLVFTIIACMASSQPDAAWPAPPTCSTLMTLTAKGLNHTASVCPSQAARPLNATTLQAVNKKRAGRAAVRCRRCCQSTAQQACTNCGEAVCASCCRACRR